VQSNAKIWQANKEGDRPPNLFNRRRGSFDKIIGRVSQKDPPSSKYLRTIHHLFVFDRGLFDLQPILPKAEDHHPGPKINPSPNAFSQGDPNRIEKWALNFGH